MSRLEEVQACNKVISDIATDMFSGRVSNIRDISVVLTVMATELMQISETLAMMFDKGEK